MLIKYRNLLCVSQEGSCFVFLFFGGGGFQAHSISERWHTRRVIMGKNCMWSYTLCLYCCGGKIVSLILIMKFVVCWNLLKLLFHGYNTRGQGRGGGNTHGKWPNWSQLLAGLLGLRGWNTNQLSQQLGLVIALHKACIVVYIDLWGMKIIGHLEYMDFKTHIKIKVECGGVDGI